MKKEFLNELVSQEELQIERKIEGYSRYRFNLEMGKIYDEKQEQYLNPKVNKRGYRYVNLQADNGERKVISVHKAMIWAALEGFDYSILFKMANLTIDHINGDGSDNRWVNLNVLSHSDNLKKRRKFIRRGKFSQDELKQLHREFAELDVKHGELMDEYERIANEFNSSIHTIQVKYLEYKRTVISL